MSLKQRRDHRVLVGETHQGITLCRVCGERVRYIPAYDTTRHEAGNQEAMGHWRHWRRS